MSTVQGSLQVKNILTVDRRANQGMSRETITSQRDVVANDFSWLQLSNASTQDVVLPDATTLPNGWEIGIGVDDASVASVNVKTYHAVTPVLLRNIIAGRQYRLKLIDNSTAAGVWSIDFLEEADKIAAGRYVDSFNATSDWTGPSGGYYSHVCSQATHLMGTSPMHIVQEGSGPFSVTSPEDDSTDTSGNITIKVPSSPDLRFAGKIIVM